MTISWKMLHHKKEEKHLQKNPKISPEKNRVNHFIYGLLAFFTILFLGVALACILVGCTLNMIMTHTEGHAMDVVDSDPETKPQVETTVKIPTIP